MEKSKNKFIILLIIAIIVWLILWTYLGSKNKVTSIDDASVPANFSTTWTIKNEKVKDAGDVIKKLDELAK